MKLISVVVYGRTSVGNRPGVSTETQEVRCRLDSRSLGAQVVQNSTAWSDTGIRPYEDGASCTISSGPGTGT